VSVADVWFTEKKIVEKERLVAEEERTEQAQREASSDAASGVFLDAIIWMSKGSGPRYSFQRGVQSSSCYCRLESVAKSFPATLTAADFTGGWRC